MSNFYINILCLCAVRNRADKTKNSIQKLKLALDDFSSILYDLVVVDDGSTDCTSEILRSQFKDVKIIYGDGSLFWAGGMTKGFNESWNSKYTHLLVFNDDSDFIVDKVINALSYLSNASGDLNNSIFVGAFTDDYSEQTTYGVQRRKKNYLPYSFVHVPISNELKFGDTLNMNFAIIPSVIINEIGFLDGYFTHSMADFDYGLRAKKAGFNIVQLPSFIGICPRNSKINTWEDQSLNFFQKIESLQSVKNFPPRERVHLLMRHAGVLMPLYFIYPYMKIMINTIFPRRG